MTPPLTPGQKRFLIVFNPLPNRQRKARLQRLLLRLKQGNHDWQLFPTDENYAANKHSFDLHTDKFSDVIVLGGDGTFNLVVNLIQGHNVRVGLIPAGTGNDFARAWYGKSRNNVSHILNVVLGERAEPVSLGCCAFEDVKQSESGQLKRYFHNILGTGFDAALAKDLRHNKGWIQSLGYVLAAVKHIPFFKEPNCEIETESQTHTYHNLITVFANSKFFGNGMPVAPDADPKSSNLQLVRVGKHKAWTKLALITQLLLGRHKSSPHVDMKVCNDPTFIKTPGLDLEADGEYIGTSPCQVSVVENALLLKR